MKKLEMMTVMRAARRNYIQKKTTTTMEKLGIRNSKLERNNQANDLGTSSLIKGQVRLLILQFMMTMRTKVR